MQPLVNNDYILEKFPGKGGWTYAAIPEIIQNKSNPFGWVNVRGFIDNYEIQHYKLMPMGNGRLFLPVKAKIRTIIGKNAGDTVRVVLYENTIIVTIPEELRLCLMSIPEAFCKFTALPDEKQHALIHHIYDARTEKTKEKRIMNLLQILDER